MPVSAPTCNIYCWNLPWRRSSIIWLPISILTTITSAHDTLGYIFPMLRNSHPTYPAVSCHSEIWNKPKTGCEYRLHFVEFTQIKAVSLWKWKTPDWVFLGNKPKCLFYDKYIFTGTVLQWIFIKKHRLHLIRVIIISTTYQNVITVFEWCLILV